ncbi:hypothetical protein Scep_012541 [Stephania cephalantha]|uniref:Uncharacterized protein n=1 Tax=Stephania cephalantha TaxID=152367 RepID=A0AAP0P6T1_9MAGN
MAANNIHSIRAVSQILIFSRLAKQTPYLRCNTYFILINIEFQLIIGPIVSKYELVILVSDLVQIRSRARASLPENFHLIDNKIGKRPKRTHNFPQYLPTHTLRGEITSSPPRGVLTLSPEKALIGGATAGPPDRNVSGTPPKLDRDPATRYWTVFRTLGVDTEVLTLSPEKALIGGATAGPPGPNVSGDPTKTLKYGLKDDKSGCNVMFINRTA